MKTPIQLFSQRFLVLVENLGLLAIAVATVFSMAMAVNNMLVARQVTLADLLLLFLYLEVLAMVGLYYSTGKLPVRFPLYIGMVALARYLILDMKAMDDWRLLAVTGSVLILATAVLVIRYGHNRFPYPGDETASNAPRKKAAQEQASTN